MIYIIYANFFLKNKNKYELVANTNLCANSTEFSNCLLEAPVVVVSVTVGTVIQQLNGYVCNPGKLLFE